MGGEVPNVGEEDCEIQLLVFASSSPVEFIKVEHDNVLCIIEETADDHATLNAGLTGEPREIVPAPLGCHFLFDYARWRDVGKSVEDLDPAGGAARPASALMEMGDSVAYRDLEQRLTLRHILERGFVKVSDFRHISPQVFRCRSGA